MKIGCIGSGNMVSSIIKGWINGKNVSIQDIAITASSVKHAQQTAQTLGVRYFETNEALVQNSDIIVLGVKPQVLPDVLNNLPKNLFTKEKLFVSIAAGISIDSLHDLMLPETKLARVMPNINIAIQKSVNGLSFSNTMTEDDKQRIIHLLEELGSYYLITESQFVNFTAIAGCSPAFTALYVDGLSRAAVANGLPLNQAKEIVIDAMIGTLQNMKEANISPWDLINQVSSPGGTTIQGVASLEKDGMIPSLFNAVNATIKRDQELK